MPRRVALSRGVTLLPGTPMECLFYRDFAFFLDPAHPYIILQLSASV